MIFKNEPRVTVVIPVYNREALLGEAIRSALDQSLDDIEVVVVDNASTDRTWEVCQDYASRDQRVRVFRNHENIGPVRNWLRCLELARGTYCKILFSDDTIDKTFLEKCLAFFDDHEVGFVFTAALIGTDATSSETAYRFPGRTGVLPSSQFIDVILSGGDAPYSPGCALFRLEDLRASLLPCIPSPSISDFESHGAGPDVLIYLLTAVRYRKIAHIQEPLAFFRAHGGSLSLSDRRQHLLRCYRQAKIWFALQYADERATRAVCAREWKRECREEGEWRSPRAVLGQYMEEPPRLFFLGLTRFFRKVNVAYG